MTVSSQGGVFHGSLSDVRKNPGTGFAPAPFLIIANLILAP